MSDAKRVWQYVSGTSGTVNVPKGAIMHIVSCHSTAGGSVTIGDGSAIAVAANGTFNLQFTDDSCICGAPPGQAGQSQMMTTNKTVVFSTTDSYFVAWFT